MDTKIKWLQSEELTAAAFKKVAVAINAHTYSASVSKGFLVSRSRSGAISARYIEKLSGNRELVDPFGNRIPLPYVTYETVQFRFSHSYPQIELINASRGQRKLFTFLNSVTGESLAAAPLDIDVGGWIKMLGRRFGKVTISEAEFQDVSITPTLAADVRFFGAGAVLSDALEFLGHRATSIARVKIELPNVSRRISMELTRRGLIRVSGRLEPEYIDALRETLSDLEPRQ